MTTGKTATSAKKKFPSRRFIIFAPSAPAVPRKWALSFARPFVTTATSVLPATEVPIVKKQKPLRASNFFTLLFLSLAVAAGIGTAARAGTFAAGKNDLLKDGQPFFVRGVVYVPFLPGMLPWELADRKQIPEELQSKILKDLKDIKAMGANTVRFWDAPRFAYQALKEAGGLALIQTVWFDVKQNDLQDEAFKKKCKGAISKTIDRVYSVYSPENPPPLLALIVGSELTPASIENTNELHPEMNAYQGKYISAPKGSKAAECFLAEMADFAKTYEASRYGRTSLVSYANEIRTNQLIDTPFLDFRSFNVYSYAILDYESPQKGSSTGTIFQGWIEELKRRYPDKPLLITETGLSDSPGAGRMGPPDYGYGGNTEEDQAAGLVQNWKDVTMASPPLAGMVIHEYLDAWWKFGREDSRTQDSDDVEEWFGIAGREAYKRLQALWAKAST